MLSIIVLQHMEPRYARAYIAEFLRVLRPGGVACFQVPATMSTPLPAALADGAWQAAISLDGKPLRQLRSGDHVPLRVRVRNAGSAAWPPGSRVTLGNHWADRRGRRLVPDDARCALPVEVTPGEEVSLELTVTVPRLSGRARLELDMVQEQVGWFASRGSKTLSVPVTIVSGSEPLPEADASFAPRMEMHSVSREAVTATVAQMGGEVLDALPDGNAGAGFLGFRYVVRRTSLTERPVRRQWLEDLEATIAAIVDRPDMSRRCSADAPGGPGRTSCS